MDIKILTLDELRKRSANYETLTEAINNGLTFELFDDGVHYITAGAAHEMALAGPASGEMNFDFLHELSTGVCAALLSYSGNLCMNYVATLEDSAATVLGNYKGGLSLAGIEKLSDNSIDSLCKIPGRLALNGLTSISKRAAVALSSRKAPTILNDFTEASLVSWRLMQKSLGELLIFESWDKEHRTDLDF